MWLQQDPMLTAHDPCKNYQEEREYDLALRDPNRCFGQGTKEDPLVVWLARPRHLKRDLVWKHNNFAKSIAKMLGCTHTWIIKTATNKKYGRDADGRRHLTNTRACTETSDTPHRSKRYILEHTDMHIELRLGTDLYDCRLSARAYVVLDKRKNPDGYMTELGRRFNRKGMGRQLEFQRWDNPRTRVLSREPIRLGPNWNAHANVGPYLDTYRPSKASANVECTPRNVNPPTREFVDKLGFCGGGMSDEMRAMVRRCHVDYGVYQRLHDELVSSEDPSLEDIAELQLLREHLVTTKREIYRETKGILV
ncbi:hypothetical protein NPX13_g191 [Xylaria arbuscula]|uniref:Uncharacterized protein n=1 Tax=Xylaria arbuscula TaxID=114810 RepID=A0A9W8NNZ9_9PEZI|nr:hypothetical protein NPX13_g191 [Xylaria arbuscula]